MSHYSSPLDVPDDHRAPQERVWVHRLVIGLNIFVATCLIAAVATLGMIWWQYGKIGRLNLNNILGSDEKDEPMNVLLVGSDSRSELAQESKKFGTASKVAGQRSDTIMILHIEPDNQKASILSIPRDLWVNIGGTGRMGKINSAFDEGPDVLIDTIQSELDIPINHYAEVDFNGFRGIVNAVGGVKVYFPSPVRDRDPSTGRNNTGLYISKAGCIELDGETALAYARSRYYQTYVDGRWRYDPTADFGRIQRQQDFIRRMISEAIRKGARNPVTLTKLINAGTENLTVDDQLGKDDMVRIGKKFRSLEPDAVEMLTLPGSLGRAGGGQSVILMNDESRAVIERFKNETPEAEPGSTVPHSAVRVRVLNGSGRQGQASQAAQGLQAQGFNIADQGNTPAFNYPKTVIEYGRGQKAKAEAVATVVEGSHSIRENLSMKGVDVVLITGSSFTGIAPKTAAAPSAPGRATTTTTAAPKQAADAQASTVPAC